jgi:c-di-GMP-binding flagellar brake protein YcgR
MNKRSQAVPGPSSTEEDKQDAAKNIPFRHIGMKVGDRLIVDPPPKLGEQSAVARLIGYVNDQSLLVTMPDTRNWSGPPIEGDIFSIRAFSGRHAYSFVTDVIKRAVSPFEYLHLNFPRRITARQIRNAERVATMLDARIIEGAQPVPVKVTNFSASGAEIRAPEPVRAVGDALAVEITLDIHAVRTPVLVDAVIRSVSEIAGSAEYAYGVQFIDINAQTSILLKSFVYQHLVEQPHKRL